ncbi:MAG TPA: gas vesicle protein GvpG [Ktedonobacterales bacterium]
MQLLSEILMSPVKGPTRALGFVMKRIQDQVASEYLDEGKVQAELLDLTFRYERGEVNDEQFQEQQAAILQHLNDIRNYKQAMADDSSAPDDVSDVSDGDSVDEASETIEE